jgi:hypothetical protein
VPAVSTSSRGLQVGEEFREEVGELVVQRGAVQRAGVAGAEHLFLLLNRAQHIVCQDRGEAELLVTRHQLPEARERLAFELALALTPRGCAVTRVIGPTVTTSTSGVAPFPTLLLLLCLGNPQ